MSLNFAGIIYEDEHGHKVINLPVLGREHFFCVKRFIETAEEDPVVKVNYDSLRKIVDHEETLGVRDKKGLDFTVKIKVDREELDRAIKDIKLLCEKMGNIDLLGL